MGNTTRPIRMIRATMMLAAALMLMAPSTARAADAEEVTRNIANYLPNLVMDFIDIFKLNIGVGDGAGADLRFTRLLEGGIGKYDVTRYGINGRDSPVFDESIDEQGVGLIGITIGDLDRDPYEIGLTLHTQGGFEIAGNLRSLADLITGIILIDLEGDDQEFF
jgi:hypothetical protein